MESSKDLYFNMQSELIEKSINDVKEGLTESFEVYAYLDAIEKRAKYAKSQIKDIVIEESKNYLEGNQKEFEKSGIKFSIRSGSTRYNFSKIKKYQEKQKELKAIEEQSKQAFLSMQKGLLTATEDGEEIELPEISYTSDSVIVKFL